MQNKIVIVYDDSEFPSKGIVDIIGEKHFGELLIGKCRIDESIKRLVKKNLPTASWFNCKCENELNNACSVISN